MRHNSTVSYPRPWGRILSGIVGTSPLPSLSEKRHRRSIQKQRITFLIIGLFFEKRRVEPNFGAIRQRTKSVFVCYCKRKAMFINKFAAIKL